MKKIKMVAIDDGSYWALHQKLMNLNDSPINLTKEEIALLIQSMEQLSQYKLQEQDILTNKQRDELLIKIAECIVGIPQCTNSQYEYPYSKLIAFVKRNINGYGLLIIGKRI